MRAARAGRPPGGGGGVLLDQPGLHRARDGDGRPAHDVRRDHDRAQRRGRRTGCAPTRPRSATGSPSWPGRCGRRPTPCRCRGGCSSPPTASSRGPTTRCSPPGSRSTASASGVATPTSRSSPPQDLSAHPGRAAAQRDAQLPRRLDPAQPRLRRRRARRGDGRPRGARPRRPAVGSTGRDWPCATRSRTAPTGWPRGPGSISARNAPSSSSTWSSRSASACWPGSTPPPARSGCRPPANAVPTPTGSTHMKVLRTPDERFEGLPGFDFAPHYAEVPDGDGGTPAHALPRRGTGRRAGRAADARRAVVVLPLPHDDPGAGRGRAALHRPRPGRLRPLRQADRARRLHLRAPRRVGPQPACSTSWASTTSPSSARTGAGWSACAWSPSTRTASPGSRSATPACPPGTSR